MKITKEYFIDDGLNVICRTTKTFDDESGQTTQKSAVKCPNSNSHCNVTCPLLEFNKYFEITFLCRQNK